jgi:hypothetical protein
VIKVTSGNRGNNPIYVMVDKILYVTANPDPYNRDYNTQIRLVDSNFIGCIESPSQVIKLIDDIRKEKAKGTLK